MANEKREQISIPVDPALRAQLEQVARAEDRTLAAQVRHFCIKALAQQNAPQAA